MATQPTLAMRLPAAPPPAAAAVAPSPDTPRPEGVPTSSTGGALDASLANLDTSPLLAATLPFPPSPVAASDAPTASAEVPPLPRLRLQVAVGPALVLRPSLAPALGVPVGAGLLVDGRDWFFVEAAPLTDRTLNALGALGDDRRVETVEVRAGYAWCPDRAFAPMFGAVAGVSVRSWYEEDTRVHAAAIPVVGAEGGAVLRLTPAMALRATARFEGDLALTTVSVGDAPAVPLSRWQPSLGISLIAHVP